MPMRASLAHSHVCVPERQLLQHWSYPQLVGRIPVQHWNGPHIRTYVRKSRHRIDSKLEWIFEGVAYILEPVTVADEKSVCQSPT